MKHWIHHFIVVGAGQRRCKSKARSTLRKGLPRGGTNTPAQRAAAAIPKCTAGSDLSNLPSHSAPIPFSRRFPVSASGIYTTVPVSPPCTDLLCLRGFSRCLLPRRHGAGTQLPADKPSPRHSSLQQGQRLVLPQEPAERCSGRMRPSRSSQRLLLDTVQILALEPAAQRQAAAQASRCTAVKNAAQVRERDFSPPGGGTNSEHGFICEASELLPTPSSSSSSGMPLWNRVLDKDFSLLQLGTFKPSDFSY